MSPLKAKHPCSHAGCRNVTSSRYCKDHERDERRYDEFRGSAAQRGYDSQWMKVRMMKLCMDPLCEEHLRKGEIVKAEMIHHIKPINEGGDRLDMENLMSLCFKCHEEKHQRN